MDIIKNFIYPNKNDILDPLSIIVKLFIYSHKPVGTKISIYHNKFIIQDAHILQSTIRTIYRDTKNDINIIYFPVMYACEHFLSVTNRNEYYNLFKNALSSFDKMKETYQKKNEIYYSIEQLQNIMKSFLEKENFNPITIIENYNSPASTIKKNIYKHINSVWTEDRLNILFGYVNEIISCNSLDLTKILIDSLSCFLEYIDLLTESIIADL